MSIQEHLNKIRNAIYGREVRESIAKGIETAYDDASEKDNANMEVKIARGTHPNLRTRLDKVDNKLATDVFHKIHGININDFDEETINFIHDGTGGPIEINSIPKEGSVRPSSTNFAKLGKNKFEGDYLRNMALMGPSTAEPKRMTFNTFPDGVVAVARIEPGEHWTVSKEPVGDRFRVALSDEYPKLGDQLANYKVTSDSETSHTIYAETEKYLLVYVSGENEFPLIQVEKGQTATDYEEPRVAFNHVQGSIESSAVAHHLPVGVLTGLKESFVVDFEEEKIITSSSGGVITAGNKLYTMKNAEYPFTTGEPYGINIVLNPETSELELLTVFEEEERQNKILIGFIRKEQQTAFIFGNHVVTGNNIVEGLPIGVLTGLEESFIVDFQEEKIITSEDGSYISTGNKHYSLQDAEYPFSTVDTYGINIVLNPETSELELLTVFDVEGRQNKILIGFIRKEQKKSFIFGNHVAINEIDNSDRLIKLFGDDGSYYNAVDTTPIHQNLADYYQEWETLMATVNAKKDVLTTTIKGNEVISYEFKMPDVHQGITYFQGPKEIVDYIRPKIVVISGTHGNEKESIFGTLSFFKDLIENPESQQALKFIKMNAEFVVVPLVNPDGFEAHTRKNGNGVDLNRNFPFGWLRSSDPESVYYSGPSAGSELETQAMLQFIREHKDALMAIEIHDYDNITANNDALWIGASNKNVQRIYYGFAYAYSEILKEDFPILQQFDNNIFRVRDPIKTGGLSGQFIREGLNGMLLELASSAAQTSRLESQRMSSHIIGNMVLTTLRSYEELLG